MLSYLREFAFWGKRDRDSRETAVLLVLTGECEWVFMWFIEHLVMSFLGMRSGVIG